ncbi:hypothetical protein WJX77_006518 [Trebouxia sp. C0004]
MADVQLHYLSKANTNFPSLTSPEQSRTEIAQTLECLNAEYLQLKQAIWPEVLPLVKQLLTKAMYVDLAGNYLPALLPEQLELQDMLKQNVSFTAPNRYLGSTNWIRDWTSKAHEFRQKAYREEAEEDSDCD